MSYETNKEKNGMGTKSFITIYIPNSFIVTDLPFSFPSVGSCHFFLLFTMASKFDSSLELSPYDQAILRIIRRNEKGGVDGWPVYSFLYLYKALFIVIDFN
jgi:hypothetical protein